MSDLKIDRRGWEFNTTLDQISTGLGLPLQLLDLRALRQCMTESEEDFRAVLASENVKKSLGDNEEPSINSLFDQIAIAPATGAPILMQFLDTWRRFYSPDRDSYFLSTPSYPDPLFRLFREHWCWRWWELTWLISKVLKFPEDEVSREYSYGGELGNYYKISVTRLPGHADFFLLCGPVFSLSHEEGQLTKMEALESIADWFHRYVEEMRIISEEFNGRQVGNYRDNYYSPERLSRAGDFRGTIDYQRLREKGARASRVVSCVVKHYDLFLGHSKAWLEEMVGAILFDENLSADSHYAPKPKPTVLQRLRGADARPKIPYLRFNLSTLARGEPLGRQAPDIIERENGNGAPDLVIENPEQSPHLLVRSEASQGLLPEQIRYKYREFIENSSSIRKEFHLECFLMIRNWLGDNFGNLSDINDVQLPAPPALGKEELMANGRRVARRATSIYRADICTIFKYDFVNQNLLTFGFHSAGLDGGDWQKIMQPYMAHTASQEPVRRESLSYRCADSGKRQYCLSYDIETDESDPPGQRLSQPTQHSLKYGRSAVSVPMNVFGHVWGVVEFLGYQEEQFSLNEYAKMGEFSNLLGNYFHHQFLLNRMQEISTIVHESSGEWQSIVTRICDLLPEVFMCESVTLNLRDEVQPRRFKAAAYVNRPDIPEDDDRTFTLEDSKSENPSVTVYAMTQREPLEHLVRKLGEEPFGDKWLAKRGSKILKDKGYTKACLFTLKQESSDVFTGSILLLSKKENAFGRRWIKLMRFVIRHLTNSLEQLYSLKGWEHLGRRSVLHEMRRQLRGLVEGTENITRELNHQIDSDKIVLSDDINIDLGDVLFWRELIQSNIKLLGSNSMRDAAKLKLDVNVLEAIKRKSEEPSQWDPSTTKPNPPIDTILEIEKIFDIYRRESKKRNVSIKFVNLGYKKAPLLCIDFSSFSAIIQNITDNAIKYTNENRQIKTTLLESGEDLLISIRNIGEELSLDERQRIFRKGFRGKWALQSDAHLPEDESGTGYGLFLSNEIAELYGGKVEYQSSAISSDDNIDVAIMNEINPVWHNILITFKRRYLIGVE